MDTPRPSDGLMPRPRMLGLNGGPHHGRVIHLQQPSARVYFPRLHHSVAGTFDMYDGRTGTYLGPDRYPYTQPTFPALELTPRFDAIYFATLGAMRRLRDYKGRIRSAWTIIRTGDL